jgi:anti-repressor protein
MDNDKLILLKNLLGELTRHEIEIQLLETTVELNELKTQLKEIQPKIDFFDTAMSSDDLLELSAVAKVLNFKKVGRNKLFEFLRTRGIIRENNEPYQQYVDRGYFKVIEQVFENSYGNTMINRKTVVYQRGIDYIMKLLLGEGYETSN